MESYGIVHWVVFVGNIKFHKVIGSNIVYYKQEVTSHSGISSDLNSLHYYIAGIEQFSK
jgi:hypothetical protein